MSASSIILRRCCASCLRSWKNIEVLEASQKMGLQNSDRMQRRHKGYIAPAGEQARPITGFYAEMLKKPLHKVQPLTQTSPDPPSPSLDASSKTQKEQTLEKARIIFGSKLVGPAERRKEIAEASKVIAGVTVPPKPSEPDNCCMSGCVNCVWDLYRDEMEEWAEKSAQARAALQAQKLKGEKVETKVFGAGKPSFDAISMDDDGGGSDTNWTTDADAGDLFGDVPVGIREFMRTEKKLKQLHQKERSTTNA